MPPPADGLTFTTGLPNTSGTPTLADLVQAHRIFAAARREADARMIENLKAVMAESGESFALWAERLNCDAVALADYLNGHRVITERFWDAVERAFVPR